MGRIAIAGAGIAGLSAAIALKLAGYSVAIFEREQELREVGAGIQMGPHATRVMESWNLDLLGNAVEPEELELRNARSGALLNTLPLKPGARVRYGSPYLTLLRADLQKALLARAGELEIPIQYGAPVSSAREVAAEGWPSKRAAPPWLPRRSSARTASNRPCGASLDFIRACFPRKPWRGAGCCL